MTIEIHRPELEALIRERMSSGAFHDVEDVISRPSGLRLRPRRPPRLLRNGLKAERASRNCSRSRRSRASISISREIPTMAATFRYERLPARHQHSIGTNSPKIRAGSRALAG